MLARAGCRRRCARAPPTDRLLGRACLAVSVAGWAGTAAANSSRGSCHWPEPGPASGLHLVRGRTEFRSRLALRQREHRAGRCISGVGCGLCRWPACGACRKIRGAATGSLRSRGWPAGGASASRVDRLGSTSPSARPSHWHRSCRLAMAMPGVRAPLVIAGAHATEWRLAAACRVRCRVDSAFGGRRVASLGRARARAARVLDPLRQREAAASRGPCCWSTCFACAKGLGCGAPSRPGSRGDARGPAGSGTQLIGGPRCSPPPSCRSLFPQRFPRAWPRGCFPQIRRASVSPNGPSGDLTLQGQD